MSYWAVVWARRTVKATARADGVVLMAEVWADEAVYQDWVNWAAVRTTRMVIWISQAIIGVVIISRAVRAGFLVDGTIEAIFWKGRAAWTVGWGAGARWFSPMRFTIWVMPRVPGTQTSWTCRRVNLNVGWTGANKGSRISYRT